MDNLDSEYDLKNRICTMARMSPQMSMKKMRMNMINFDLEYDMKNRILTMARMSPHMRM